MQLRRVVIPAAFVGLSAFGGTAGAAEYVTSLASGTMQNCGSGNNTWALEMKGKALQGKSSGGTGFYADMSTLKPDGSGRVVSKDAKGREFYFDFEPGSGHRKFHSSNGFNACKWLFTPK